MLPRLSASASKSSWKWGGLARRISHSSSIPSSTRNGAQLSVPGLGTAFPYRWLRDACQCPACIHPSTQQKLHRTPDIPEFIAPLQDGIQVNDNSVHIRWADGHLSFYPFSFLARYSSHENLTRFHRDIQRRLWDGSSTAVTEHLFVRYESLNLDQGLLDAIVQLSRYGLLFITGVPNIETSDQTCELRSLVEKFGQLRNTFYGEVWDVKSIANSRNIAYTNLFLGFHMDLMYFEHPPRYQVLHCLRNRVRGGVSMFVDAIRVADELRTTYPEDFDLLASTPVPFHYINDGHHLHFDHPTIELSLLPDPVTALRNIIHINYSPPFQAPLLPGTSLEFYAAFARFAALLEAPSSRFEYTLQEGDAVLFDNRRVLHARTAFSDAAEQGLELQKDNTKRWLKGCYFEADMMADRARVLQAKLEES